MSIYERDPSTGELNLLAGSGGGGGGDDKNFLGTSVTWDAMTLEQQNEYDTMDFTDENEDPADAASKSDITSLKLIGTVNSTDNTITAGTWFYLNGKIVKAKTDITSGATFTKDTNYEEKTIGEELNELNGKLTIDTVSTNDFGNAPEGWTKGTCIGLKLGRIVTVQIQIYSDTGLEVGGRLQLNNFIPTGYYNHIQYNFPCVASTGVYGLLNSTASAIINVGGNNHIYVDNSSSTTIRDIYITYTLVE